MTQWRAYEIENNLANGWGHQLCREHGAVAWQLAYRVEPDGKLQQPRRG